MVSDRLTEVEAGTLSDTLVNVYVKGVIDTPDDTLSEVDAKTLGDTLVNVEVKALIKTQLATNWATC